MTKKTKNFGENKQIFFSKKPSSRLRGEIFFFQKKMKKTIFFLKKKRPLNCPFKKTDTFSHAHNKALVAGLPPLPTV